MLSPHVQAQAASHACRWPVGSRTPAGLGQVCLTRMGVQLTLHSSRPAAVQATIGGSLVMAELQVLGRQQGEGRVEVRAQVS